MSKKSERRTINIMEVVRMIKEEERLIMSSQKSDAKNNVENETIRGPYDDFCKDFLSLLDDTSFSDVTIKCCDETMNAHKNILSARSPVFKAMFSSNMKESSEGVVSIDDLDPQIVRDLLLYIYSNQVQNLSVPKAFDLMNAAEKYQLPSLKQICVLFVKTAVSLENAFVVLQKADLYDEKLRLHTMKFICRNFSALKRSDDWKSVQSNNPTLALEVFNKVVDHLETSMHMF